MIRLARITQQQAEFVEHEALKDGHYILNPTHVMTDEKGVRGCFSVGAIPMVLAWIDTRQGKARDTKQVVDLIESSLRFQGCPYVAFPCNSVSPLFQFAERVGYKAIYPNNTLFIKSL